MAGQEMQVRWRHHQVGLLTYLRQMLTSEVFVDVTLCCQNKRLKAHRVLLSACSPYLQELLLAHPVSDHTTIILDDINYDDMKSLLDFVYTGGVTIPESRLESFLNAAQTLHITVLTDKNLHQQLPTEDIPIKGPFRHEEKNIPPLIKFDHEKNIFMNNFRPCNRELNPLHFNSNGFKLNNRFKTSPHPELSISEDKEQIKRIGQNNNYEIKEDLRNTNEFRKCLINENDVKPPARELWNNLELLRQTDEENKIRKNIHDSFKIHPGMALGQHGYPVKQNVCRSDFMDTSPSQEVKEFPWARRPIPSLRPISMIPPALGSGPFVRKLAPPKRSLGGILTPSPWSQSGRPPVGAPRIIRAERSQATLEQSERNESSPAKSPEHLSDANNTGSTTAGSVPSSPKLKTLLSEREVDQSSKSPSPGYTMENDENKPQYNSDVIKLCRLKERRLQDFYREQMLSNGVLPSNGSIELDKSSDYDEVSDLSIKKSAIPLFGDQENYVNFHANRLHHITRILGTDNSRIGEEVNPLHGLKTLANLLDDKSVPVGPVLQRRRSLSCSDLAEDNVLRPNDTNNNEEDKSNDMDDDTEDGTKGNQTNLSCEDCGKVFGRRQLLVQHRRIHTGERPYVCGACGKQFTQRGHWTAHQKLHEDSRQPEHSCSQCGKAFVTRASLKVHLRTHTGEKPFHCLECGKQFSQLRNYKYHRSVHEGTREFAATCPECGKYFNDRGYLSSHMKIHRNRKEYGCEYCGKSFNQRVAYNMHVRIHTGEKPHVCQHCNKSFSRKMLLKQHLRIHTGEKPFSCVVCQKAFADRSNMTLHMRLHSGVKPYTCSVCSKSFTKKHHLKTHMNYHTGVKPYVCSKCGLRFSQSSNMRTHYKKCSSVATYQNIPTPPSSVSTTANSIPSSSPLQHMTTTSGVTPPNSDESSSSSSIVKDNAEHQ